jgi:hypothetical protein
MTTTALLAVAFMSRHRFGGKCKIFYEQAGEGKQEIVFLHTAGSDSQQYHGCVVFDPELFDIHTDPTQCHE